jgi:Tfp pilus assembly protein PilO
MRKIGEVLENRQIFILAFCLTFFLSFLLFKYIYQPQRKGYQNLRKIFLDRLDYYQKTSEKISRDKSKSKEELLLEIASLEKRFPPQRRISQLISQLDNLTQQMKLKIISLNPRPVKNYKEYNEIPFEIKLTCTYHDLGRFFNQLENLTSFIFLSEIEITPLNGKNLSAELVATAFSLRQEETFTSEEKLNQLTLTSLHPFAYPSVSSRPFRSLLRKTPAKVPSALRLTLIVWDEKNPMATVKYRGKSYVVRPGDVIGGERVLSIQKNCVWVVKNGYRIKLTVWPKEKR